MKRQLLSVLVLMIGIFSFCLMECSPTKETFSTYPLIGKVIGIDPGHGGYDGGCEGVTGTVEKDINLSIALLIRAELEDRGATVIMSRETDMALIDPLQTKGYKKRQELNHRIIRFTENHTDAMVSIHMNASTDRSARGARVFFKEGEEEGRILAECIANELLLFDPQYAQAADEGDYYMLGTCPASVLCECGFLTNPMEETLLCSEEYRRELSLAICDGIERYFAQNVVIER